MSERRRILVVDDDHDIRDLAGAVLSGAGYEVELATSGSEALRQTRERTFDLVLLDINMPEMDGWETLRLLQADLKRSHPPIVMFTVKGEVRDKIQGLQEGAAGYITKPFVIDVFLSRVRRVLEQGADPESSTTPLTPWPA